MQKVINRELSPVPLPAQDCSLWNRLSHSVQTNSKITPEMGLPPCSQGGYSAVKQALRVLRVWVFWWQCGGVFLSESFAQVFFSFLSPPYTPPPLLSPRSTPWGSTQMQLQIIKSNREAQKFKKGGKKEMTSSL